MPGTGGFIRHATKFVEPALGAATGWNFCELLLYIFSWLRRKIRHFAYRQLGYTMAITVPAEISAAATVIQFWNKSINPGVWITIFLVVIIILNLCGVRLYGEVRIRLHSFIDDVLALTIKKV